MAKKEITQELTKEQAMKLAVALIKANTKMAGPMIVKK